MMLDIHDNYDVSFSTGGTIILVHVHMCIDMYTDNIRTHPPVCQTPVIGA